MHPKAQTKILKFLFILNYTTSRVIRGFERLSSFSCRRVTGLQSFTKTVVHAGLKGFPN